MSQDTLKANTSRSQQVNAIKANDESVLKAVYQENYPKVENWILANNGSVDHAKDIYQEAFIAMWRNIQHDKFQPQSETSLSGYLYRIAQNKWLDYLRSSQHRKTTDIDESFGPADETTEPENDELILAVKEKFSELGENCREILNRFYYRKESMKVIANAYNWTDATARNNKYRCLQKLRDLIKKKENS